MLGRIFGGRRRRLAEGAQAFEQGRLMVESVIGLPHVLAAEVLKRNFGDQVTPSSDLFRDTGRDGDWTFPRPHPEVLVRVHGDETGRVVFGLVMGEGEYGGVLAYTHWSRFVPAPEWQLELREEEAGALSADLHATLERGE